MDGAQAPDHFAALDADHAAGGEEFLQRLEGSGVVGRMTVDGHKNDAVGDIEIRVGRRQALAVVFHDAGHRDRDDVEGLAVLVLHGTEPLQIILKGFIILVLWVLLHDRDDGVRTHEARDVVHVAVRVVADNAVAQPEDVGHAQEALQVILYLDLDELGVSILVQKALLGREKRPLAVHVDRSALEHDTGLDAFHPQIFRGVLGDDVVQVPRPVLLAPRVEDPIQDFDLLLPALAVFRHEDGSVVAGPGVVRRELMEDDIVEDVVPLQHRPHLHLHLRVLHVDMDRLMDVERLDHLDPNRRYELHPARPGLRIVWPREPRRFMGFEFRGHAEAFEGVLDHYWFL